VQPLFSALAGIPGVRLAECQDSLKINMKRIEATGLEEASQLASVIPSEPLPDSVPVFQQVSSESLSRKSSEKVENVLHSSGGSVNPVRLSSRKLWSVVDE